MREEKEKNMTRDQKKIHIKEKEAKEIGGMEK